MRIKVLSYNVHKGRAFFSREKTWQTLEKLWHFVDPDIVLLQEFLHEPEGEKLLESMADLMWPHHSLGQNAATGNYKYGNVIISKFPILQTHNTSITNHFLEKRGILYARIQPIPDQDFHLFCTHLDLSHQGREKQISKIEKMVKELVPAEAQLILAGDFNDWSAKLDVSIRSKLNLDEAFLNCKGHFAKTSPSVLPVFPLDRIYFRHLKVVECRVLQSQSLRFSSDHLPLVASFDLT